MRQAFITIYVILALFTGFLCLFEGLLIVERIREGQQYIEKIFTFLVYTFIRG